MKKFLGLAFITLSFISIVSSAYETGTIQFTPLGSGIYINPGMYQEVGRFRLANQGDKNILLNSIRFKNYGTADLDEALSNIGLFVNGELISGNAYTDRDNVTFVLGNFVIPRGDSVIFSIRADVNYVRAGETIQLGVRYVEDINAVETNTGFRTDVTGLDNQRLKTYTTDLGGLSISRQPNYYTDPYYSPENWTRSTYTPYTDYSPNWYPYARNYGNYNRNYPRYEYDYDIPRREYPRYTNYNIGNQQYSPGARDVTFLNTFPSAKNPIRTEGVFVPLSDGSYVSDKNGNGIPNEPADYEQTFKNFRLYVDGKSEDTTNHFEYRNGQLGLLFDTEVNIHGNSNFRVVGRIQNDAMTGDKIKLQVNNASFIDPEYLNTGHSVPAEKIYGGGYGNYVETETRRLNITK